MLRMLAPGLDGLLVAPERYRHVLAFVGDALKALHGDKTVDRLQLRFETASEIEVILISTGIHLDFEYDS